MAILCLVFPKVVLPKLLIRVDVQLLLNPLGFRHGLPLLDLSFEQVGTVGFQTDSAFTNVSLTPGQNDEPLDNQFVVDDTGKVSGATLCCILPCGCNPARDIRNSLIG